MSEKTDFIHIARHELSLKVTTKGAALKRTFAHIIAILFWLSFASQTRAQSCNCESIQCDPCEIQTGVSFYTEKCEGGRTKSCQRPKCELPEKPPVGCDVAIEQTREQSLVAANSKNENSQESLVTESKQVGVFALVRGEVKLISKGNELVVKVGTSVREKDVVVTNGESVAKIIMQDKNVLYISKNSRLKIKGFESAEDKGYSTSTLDLVYGKIRSQVVTKNKFADKPTFKVRTPSAVAGVRGTDFIVTHVQNGDVTKVETLSGTVELGGYGSDEKTLIKKGQYASYVVLASNNRTGTFSDDDIGSFIHKGFLTPVYQLSDQQYEKLNIETEFREDGSDRIIAESKNSPICSKPKGDLNQCAWICENNPTGESKCRTDLANVKCVRYKCDANGRWSHEERVPANSSGFCQSAPVVGNCNY